MVRWQQPQPSNICGVEFSRYHTSHLNHILLYIFPNIHGQAAGATYKMDENLEDEKMTSKASSQNVMKKPSPPLRLGLHRSTSRPMPRCGTDIGNNFSSNKKALFKPWTESTPKSSKTSKKNPIDNVTPIKSSLKDRNRRDLENALPCGSEENTLINKRLIKDDIFSEAHRESSKKSVPYRSTSLNIDDSRRDMHFIKASQALKKHSTGMHGLTSPVVSGSYCPDELLSLNESIFGSVNLEEVEKLYYNGIKSDQKSVSLPSQKAIQTMHDQYTDLGSPLQKRKKLVGQSSAVIEPAVKTDSASGNLLPSQNVVNESPSLIIRPTCSGITQSFPQSMIPMSEKIRRALLENAQKPISPKPQAFITPVGSPDIFPSSILSRPRSKNTSPINRSQMFELGPFFGLPSEVKNLIHHFKGIKELYPWQVECLHLPALKDGRNLIYALPTSGGKTLVAEIMILQELLCRKKNVIFILPYVSIVQEKVRALSIFAVPLNFLVEEYAAGKGSYPPRKRRWKQSVYVCTIEKALGLTNSLIEGGRLSEIGLVVVDELHLIGDGGGRGATLEGLLTKILYSTETIQIVGMSATIGNLREISEFLRAETYTQNFRPIELTEHVKLENSVYVVNPNTSEENILTLKRTLAFEYTRKMLQIDPDMVAGLVLEVVPMHSCLVFCATRQNCENVAVLLSRMLPSDLMLEHKKPEKLSLYAALRDQGNGSVCAVLSQTLPYGIAYHHSGLTGDERRLIEESYLSGTICCICCTSTLAAGVNLPAKRVILRSPYVGRDFINLSRYKQMVGRAGRAGLGDSGESFLMCAKNDARRVAELLQSKMDESTSSLHNNNSKGMQNLVLSAIGLGLATTRANIHSLVQCTLLKVQESQLNVDVKQIADDTINNLFKSGAVKTVDETEETSILHNNLTIQIFTGANTKESLDTDEDIVEPLPIESQLKRQIVVLDHTELTISRLGRAAMKGSIELSRARLLYEDLKRAQASFVCLSCLHLLYLITPYDQADQTRYVGTVYFAALQQLDKNDMATARMIGISESAMTSLMRGQLVKGVQERVVKRFYITLMLNDLWAQKSTWEVAEKFQISRGFIQSLMSKSSAFASCVMRFCEELDEMWCFKDLLGSFTQRLAHCCSLELLPLMDLPAVKRGRAKQLYNAGYKTVMDVAKADVRTLVEEIELLPRKIAHQIIAAAKMLLVEKVETLKEDAADAMEVLAMGNEALKF